MKTFRIAALVVAMTAIAGVPYSAAEYVSPPWWSSWSNCSITPFEMGEGDTFIAQFPRIKVAQGDMEVTGSFFAGSRPLPVDGQYPDGSFAKVYWQFSERVEGLSVLGVNVNGSSMTAQIVADTNPVNSSSGVSAEWTSNFVIPEAGCWEIQLNARDASGESFVIGFTAVAVE